ncbi:hypothetical protein PPYR_11691 [Photinus pyralis]|uniref:Secreted protein n=1 Tax=Photinus pyralis TaxID=7054 RepID=A0A5N4AC18_PHOPY|nr:hypothetical protein PPYR_11691 [Photinus pyralis]
MILLAKKMQLVYVAVLLTLRGASSNLVKRDEPFQKDDLIESKCKKATVVDHYTGFYKTFIATVVCLEARDKSAEACDVLNQDTVRGCLKAVGDVAQRCLQEEERYFPKFFLIHWTTS